MKDFLDENRHRKQYLLLQFHKMVNRSLVREIGISNMFIDIFFVKAF